MIERTLVIIKPDGMRRKLADKIIARYAKVGLKIMAKKEARAGSSLLKKHYSAHVKKPFYPSLEKFMSSGLVLAVVFEGDDAVSKAREITGVTDPAKAEKGTIRSDFGNFTLPDDERVMKNLVHTSATKEEAKKEIRLWFPELSAPTIVLLDTNIYGWALENKQVAKFISDLIDEQSKDTRRFKVFGCDIIRAELNKNPHKDTRFRTRRLYESTRAKEIKSNETVKNLAEEYFSRFKIKNIKITIEDCEIVASATANDVNYIISDNRRTLCNPRTKSVIEEINKNKGLVTPEIVTSEEAITKFFF